MKSIKRIFQYIYSIYGFVVFVLVLLLIFPFVLISTLFGKTKSGNFVYTLCRIWADIAFFLWGFNHKNIFEFPLNKEHACVYVFNHTSYMDIPVLMKTFRNQNIRILAKASMGSIPIFGLLYRTAAIMVDRSSPEARAKSIKQLKETLDKNISVVIAPEGTFNTTDCALKSFYDGAFKIAIETQTPIVPVIFPDNYNRMHYSSVFTLSPGRTRAVFLKQIEVDGFNLDDVELLKEKVFNEMEDALIRYKAPWIKNLQCRNN